MEIHLDLSLVSLYPRLDHIIQEPACLLVIDFEVHYLRNFILGFFADYNWYRSWLYFLREKVEHGRFEHGHMENWMDRVYRLWEMKGE